MDAAIGRRGISRGLSALVLLLLAASAPIAAQEASDAALRDRVLQLVERLGADEPKARDAAEAALRKLGPRVLPLLPEAAADADADEDRANRLARLREALQEGTAGGDPAAPARVTLKAEGIRLSDAVQQLQKQTGNVVTDLREQYGAEAVNPSFDLDLENVPFYEALDQVARLGNVSITTFTGDGSIGLMAEYGESKPVEAPVEYVGAFRVMLKQFAQQRDFTAGTSAANAVFEVAWEPRVRPMLLSIKADQLEIKDDQGRAIKPQVAMEAGDVVLRPENPSAEVNVNLEAPERSASRIATFRVKAEVTVPADVKTFRFPSLLEKQTIQQGDVGVTLEGVEVDEQVWKVGVILNYPGEGPAFESYRQGLFNNRLWLQKADGSRFEQNGGFSNMGSDGGRLGFEYLFVDAPGKPEDYQFVYETPSRVVAVPLDFTFQDVPLP